jgi:hypothetical protein
MNKVIDVDLDGATWVKSRRSDMSGGNCVEIAKVGDVIAVRDSKIPAGPALVYTRDEWAAFVGGVKDGEFDQ